MYRYLARRMPATATECRTGSQCRSTGRAWAARIWRIGLRGCTAQIVATVSTKTGVFGICRFTVWTIHLASLPQPGKPRSTTVAWLFVAAGTDKHTVGGHRRLAIRTHSGSLFRHGGVLLAFLPALLLCRLVLPGLPACRAVVGRALGRYRGG